MRSINIDRGWSFGYGSYNSLRAIMGENGEETVDLPHDYMIRSDVSETAAAGPAAGYYTAVSHISGGLRPAGHVCFR